ncbi:MAG: hypothetical protein ACI4PF_05715 [Christensenellales bacterium]
MDLYDKLIDLRINLSSKCDGFSLKDSSKNLILSSKIKVLFLLNGKDMTQGELILSLSMAKSNLANLLKSMINENVIESYRNATGPRNIYYKITNLGSIQLSDYKKSLKSVFSSVCTCPSGLLEKNIDEILDLLKRG